jgi:hypothetical protein
MHRIEDHMSHGATMLLGAIVSGSPVNLISSLGLVIALGGLACSVSREVRAWMRPGVKIDENVGNR